MDFFSQSFHEFIDLLKNWDILKQSISSAVLLVVFLLARWLSVSGIRRWQAPTVEEKRRWILQVKNITLIIFAGGLFGIWATELRNFALSFVAIAAAIAIATKEVIQCALGGIYKASSRPFELGDRIEIAGYRGEVIESNLMSTVLFEIGPARENQSLSGRQMVIPNSLFLSHAVYNQSLQQQYVLQAIRVTVYPHESWQDLEAILLTAANNECSSFLEPARYAMMRLRQREGIDLPRVEPRVSFHYAEDGKLQATLRFPAPLNAVSRTVQAVTRSILTARGEVKL